MYIRNYPSLISEDLWQTYEVNEEECLIRIRSYSQSESDVFPCNIGKSRWICLYTLNGPKSCGCRIVIYKKLQNGLHTFRKNIRCSTEVYESKLLLDTPQMDYIMSSFISLFYTLFSGEDYSEEDKKKMVLYLVSNIVMCHISKMFAFSQKVNGYYMPV